MFIAPDHRADQRRSEERNESSEYHSSLVPLLRTALRTLSSRSYKHATPAGSLNDQQLTGHEVSTTAR